MLIIVKKVQHVQVGRVLPRQDLPHHDVLEAGHLKVQVVSPRALLWVSTAQIIVKHLLLRVATKTLLKTHEIGPIV